MLIAEPERREYAPVSVIIVTHNSEQVIDRCMASLYEQTCRPEQITIVDSGSADSSYLQKFSGQPCCTLHLRDNIGFAAANNFAVSRLEGSSTFILFINPDTFLEPSTIENAFITMSQMENVAILTGSLRGFDSKRGQPTGRYDSTGVFRKWYGRWYDRDQGKAEAKRMRNAGAIPAVCGAFMFCRSSALQTELPDVFDQSFYMYKEDIDLSLRLRKRNWQLYYSPELTAFHCRGWSRERKRISREHRLLSAKNEIRLCAKHRSPYIVWGLFKYVLVRFSNV